MKLSVQVDSIRSVLVLFCILHLTMRACSIDACSPAGNEASRIAAVAELVVLQQTQYDIFPQFPQVGSVFQAIVNNTPDECIAILYDSRVHLVLTSRSPVSPMIAWLLNVRRSHAINHSSGDDPLLS